jgi:uncharacterized protein (TIGR00730 family)
MDKQELEENKKCIDPEAKYLFKYHPLTKAELKKELENRMERINNEFRKGFEIINAHPKSVTFFGSARFLPKHTYYKKAQGLAHKIAKEGYDIITGGGTGVMEGGNRGAHEAGGMGHSLGFNINLPFEQELNTFVEESVTFHYFFARKVLLAFSAEAYVFFPGGFGTLDEFFEIVTLVQTGKIKNVPIICVGEDFWRRLDSAFEELLEDDYKTISDGDRDLYTITEDDDRILEIIKAAPIREE